MSTASAQKLKILFDQLIWPIESKEPFRIGAGGGLRFQGSIDDVLVYKRALSAEEAAVVALPESVRQIAAMRAGRPHAGTAEQAAPVFPGNGRAAEVKQARADLAAAELERKKYYDTIPTVMVMAERDQPRETFVLQARRVRCSRREGLAQGSRRAAAVSPGVAGQSPRPGALAGGSSQSADRARHRESLLGDAVRHRPGEDGGRFRLAGRMAGSTRNCSTGWPWNSWRAAGT